MSEVRKLWSAIIFNIIATVVLVAFIGIKGDELEKEYSESYWKAVDAKNQAIDATDKVDRLINLINNREIYAAKCKKISAFYYEGVDSNISVSPHGYAICHIGKDKGTIEDLINLNISKGE